jgi:hypothetical protein
MGGEFAGVLLGASSARHRRHRVGAAQGALSFASLFFAPTKNKESMAAAVASLRL